MISSLIAFILLVPRELCLVGCVFFIADYYAIIESSTLNAWITAIQQHGGEVKLNKHGVFIKTKAFFFYFVV